MAFVILPHLLRARYGRAADRLERAVEFVLMLVIVLCCTGSVSLPMQWPGALASAAAVALLTVQTLTNSWQAWAEPPIAAQPQLLYGIFAQQPYSVARLC